MIKNLLYAVFFVVSPLSAQTSVEELLHAIEQNNTELKALKEAGNAQRLENKAETALGNPEMEFNCLWGRPSTIGNRTDVAVNQPLDASTLFGAKRRLAKSKDAMVDGQYRIDRMRILLEAKLYAIDLTYANALLRELSQREQQALALANAQKTKLEKGEINVLEYNNVCLSLSAVKSAKTKAETERRTVLSHLERLNGGKTVSFDAVSYEEDELPTDFDSWFAQAAEQSPELAYIKKEMELAQKLVTYARYNQYPTLSVGYMSEKTMGEHYQGISFGLAVPLWNSHTKVRQAKAAVKAVQLRSDNARHQLYAQLKILYEHASGLKEAAQILRSGLQQASNAALLGKALNSGQMSVVEYLVEMGAYYDSVAGILAADRDYRKACAELSAFML